MNQASLLAVSPVDGRYNGKTERLQQYFSEYALIRYRVRVEVEYFIALCAIPLPSLKHFGKAHFATMRSWYENFSIEDAAKIKLTEKTTNHDVKAVEYFLKEKFDAQGWGKDKEFIHFGLTSQDINNTAVPLLMKEAMENEYESQIKKLLGILNGLGNEWKDIPMLARTHGQPATPTLLGKEIYVFAERVKQQLELLKMVPDSAKFGGATGNMNAHYIAYPKIDWKQFAKSFLEDELGLQYSYPTTQIEHYDNLAALFDGLKRINTILIDLCRDIWQYISMEYFRQKVTKGEIGSSAMPHKVNPIDFENAEGNLGIANSFFEYLASKLPVSRLQRDLTDSTVLRNIGVPVAHTIIAFDSLQKGLGKLVLNAEKMEEDLDANWAVVAEAIQTILRRENYPQPYEALKSLTRGNNKVTEKTIHNFIDKLDVSAKVKAELKKITPFNYTGRFVPNE